MENQIETNSQSLVNDLLNEGVRSTLDILKDIMEDESPENLEELDSNLRNYVIESVINAWAKNDRQQQIFCKPGKVEAVKVYLSSLDLSVISPDVANLVKNTLDTLIYEEHSGVSPFTLRSLKQMTILNEASVTYGWANDPNVNLLGRIASSYGPLYPTTDEIRLMMLMDVMLTLREERKAKETRILVPGR